MSSHHEDSATIKRDAFRWLVGAGTFAVLLSIGLAVTDYRLSHSTRERDLGNTLRELRTAQAEVGAASTDERILNGVAAGQGRENSGSPQHKRD